MNYIIKLAGLATVGLPVLMVGCGGGSVDSTDLKTEGIHATVRIYGWDDETQVDARLTAGGPNGSDVRLTGGDSFTATAYGETKTLNREPQLFGSYDSYINEYNSNIGGSRVSLSLTRSGDPDAPYSYVDLPEPVVIYSPLDDTNVDALEEVVIRWDTAGSDNIEVVATADCYDTSGATVSGSSIEDIDDNGSHTVIFNNLFSSSQKSTLDRTRECDGEVVLTRETQGVLDSAFDGGNIKARQVDTVKLGVDF